MSPSSWAGNTLIFAKFPRERVEKQLFRRKKTKKGRNLVKRGNFVVLVPNFGGQTLVEMARGARVQISTLTSWVQFLVQGVLVPPVPGTTTKIGGRGGCTRKLYTPLAIVVISVPGTLMGP